jgi:hypothetical protein
MNVIIEVSCDTCNKYEWSIHNIDNMQDLTLPVEGFKRFIVVCKDCGSQRDCVIDLNLLMSTKHKEAQWDEVNGLTIYLSEIPKL